MKTLIIAVGLSALFVAGAGVPLAKMYNKFCAPASASAAESSNKSSSLKDAATSYKQLRKELMEQ